MKHAFQYQLNSSQTPQQNKLKNSMQNKKINGNKTNKQQQLNIYHIKTLIDLKRISCGYNYTIVLDRHSNLYSFGDNKYGQLGYGNCEQNYEELRKISNVKKFIVDQIQCGFTHVIVYNERQAYGWGDNSCGGLGYEPNQIVNPWMGRKIPMLVANDQKIINISCGNKTSVFHVGNSFYCVGDNTSKQLGLAFKKYYCEFEKIQNTKYNANNSKWQCKLVKVKAGDKFTIGLDEKGVLYGAGDFDDFGISYHQKYPSITGLTQIQIKGNQQIFKNVQDFYCGINLIIKLKNGQIMQFSRTSNAISSIQQQKDIQIISDCQQYTILKRQNNVYKWANNALQKISKNNQNIMGSCEKNGTLILIQNQNKGQNQKYVNKQQISLTYSRQISPDHNQNNSVNISRLTKMSQNYSPRHKVNMNMNKNQSRVKNSNILKLQSQKQQKDNSNVESLKKQIQQQKQIIRLYQIYVNRLEQQKMQLQSKLLDNKLQQIKQQSQDTISIGFQMLKQMLGDMIKQQQLNRKL